MPEPVRLDVDLRTRKFLIAFRARSVVEHLDRSGKEAWFPDLSWVAVPVSTCNGQGDEQQVGHGESSSRAERLEYCSVSRSTGASSGMPVGNTRREYPSGPIGGFT